MINRERNKNALAATLRWTYIAFDLLWSQMSRTTPKHWIVLDCVSTSIASRRSGRSHEHVSIPVFVDHFQDVVRLIDESKVEDGRSNGRNQLVSVE